MSMDTTKTISSVLYNGVEVPVKVGTLTHAQMQTALNTLTYGDLSEQETE